MPPERKAVPSYLEHKQSGRGRAVWYDRAGVRQQRLLPGPFKSPESVTAFGRLLLELQVSPVDPGVPEGDRANLSVAEVLLAYLRHAERHYRGPDGEPTSELRTVKLVIKSLREVYGPDPVAGFGPLKAKAVMQGWVAAGLTRGEVNRRLGVAKRILSWAVSEELAPPSVSEALRTVKGLRQGRTAARETEPVGPVAGDVVAATLAHLNRQVAGLVRFQQLTGCRPGEACRLRRCDVDAAGDVWLYRPERHKNRHRGKSRVIAIGPKARALLAEYPTGTPGDYVFSPARAVADQRAARSAGRATPRYDSHMRRNAAKRVKAPRRAAGACYTASSYSHAVLRAAAKAGVPRWHPNQLRHTFATEVRRAYGLEAAQVLLGHSKVDTTQLYTARDQALAAAVAAKIG